MEDILFVSEPHHSSVDMKEMSATDATVSKGISADQLAKVWRITDKEAGAQRNYLFHLLITTPKLNDSMLMIELISFHSKPFWNTESSVM